MGDGAKRLKSLAIIGSTAIYGGGVTTSTTQGYGGAVTIGGDPTTLTGTAVVFSGAASTVDGVSDAGQALIINADATFRGAVGTLNRLKSLTVNGATTLNLPASPNHLVKTKFGQTYALGVTLLSDASLSSSDAGDLTFGSTIVGPGGLTTNTKGLTSFAGALGSGPTLDSLSVTTGGPLTIKVDVTAVHDILFRVSKGADPATNDNFTLGDTLNPAAVHKVMSTLGNIEIDADNNISLLAGSIVQASAGSVVLKSDYSNKIAAGSQSSILLNGTINATTTGKSVTVQGNTHVDEITLAGTINSPTVNVLGIGGRDVVHVRKTVAGTNTTIFGGDAIAVADGGNNVTVNVSNAGTIDAILGVLNIKGSPEDKLAADTRALVSYSPFSAQAGSPPAGITTMPAPITINRRKGNVVNIVDTNRAVSTNNVYTLSGAGFTRTGAAAINFLNDTSNKYAIQTVTLAAGAQGNNKIRIQLPNSTVSQPLTYVEVDGGQTGASNANVLSVTGADLSAIQITGIVGTTNVSLNTIIAGDGSVNPGADEPIKFSHIRSLYLTGSNNDDFIINNSTSSTLASRVFGVLDGRAGGDWMTTGRGAYAQDVLYGGGATAPRSDFMFGRGASTDQSFTNGFFLPNQSLTVSDSTTFAGSSYIDGGAGLYSASAVNGKVNNVTEDVFLGAGSLNVVSWLRASFQRTPGNILANARNLINLSPKP